MSLINEMLKDLETQSHKTTLPQFISPKTLKLSQPRPYQKKLFLQIGISIFLFFFLYFFVSHFFTKPHTSLSQHFLAEPIKKTPLIDDEKNEEWLKPAIVTGITFQVKNDMTELAFLLNHSILYAINDYSTVNQLTLILNRTELQSALPAIHTLHSAIQRIQVENKNGDSYIHLFLIPGSVIRYLNLSDENKNPELSLSIQNTVWSSSPSISTSQSPIKTPAMTSFLSEQYHFALNLIQSGQYALAKQKLFDLLKLNPEDKKARSALVALLLQQHNKTLANQVINQGLSQFPDYLPFIELKARILSTDGKIIEAINLLESHSPPITDDPTYHGLIAALYQQNKNYLLAEKRYQKLVAIQPENGNWWIGLGVSLEHLNRKQDALYAYSEAISAGQMTPYLVNYLQNRIRYLQGVSHDKG